MKTKISAVILLLVSIALLIPGVTQPVLTLQGNIDKAKIVDVGINMLAEEGDGNTRGMLRMFSGMLGLDKLEGEVEAYRKTRSIVGTIEELANNQNHVVAVLVGLFAVIIPFLKLLMQLLSVLLPAKIKLTRLLNTAASKLSKWSMTDVFVIALIVSYLAGNADGQMGNMLKMKAELGIGFWFFTAYCVVAIASSQFVERIHKAR
ncbi:paraquat-inducible protein A [Pseudoalteromonas sp. SSM20]|uniref:paraquat-inducible protein A n=1 Tax=Pseudoalteromonas sp. SSM20 TaxID=3139394 RepID=UPI003BAC5475